MEHYVCKGCGGVSQTAGTCQGENCPNKGQALEACSCGDASKHSQAGMGGSQESAPQQPPQQEGQQPEQPQQPAA